MIPDTRYFQAELRYLLHSTEKTPPAGETDGANPNKKLKQKLITLQKPKTLLFEIQILYFLKLIQISAVFWQKKMTMLNIGGDVR